MLKTIIVLPGGAEISSGANVQSAVQNVTLTECVNSGEDLTLGSTCSNALEATLITHCAEPPFEAGAEVTVYKDDGSARKKVGVFILEKPTRPTANTMKITGYDRVSKLDKDLTAWLSGLTGWPYTLTTFAGMVCAACGLTYKASTVPNGNFPVQKFTRSSVTGRQIMQWLGEICARFCRATPDGEIEFAWYTDSGKSITTGGELYYFQNGLSYETYETAKVGAVQIRLANGDNGALWPEAEAGVNSYIITGNAILNLQITEALKPVLANIQTAMANVAYTPCKVSIPANMDIRAGNTVKITDKNGKTITAYVMTKTQSGQKDTLECTGNRERNTSAAANNKTAAQRSAESEGYADSAAQNAAKEAVDSQTQEEIFNKLTNNGEIQGIYAKDGKWYINAEIARVINLVANDVTSGKLQSLNNLTYFDLDNAEIVAKHENGESIEIKSGCVILRDKSGQYTLSLGRVADGGASLYFYNGDGSHAGGFQSGGINEGLFFWCKDIAEGVVVGQRVGWKTIHFVDLDGIPQTATILATY